VHLDNATQGCEAGRVTRTITTVFTAVLSGALLFACEGDSAKSADPKSDTPATKAPAQAKPEVEPELQPPAEPPTPPPAFMAEPELLNPKGEPFADHERRKVDVTGLARRGPESAPVTVLQCVDFRDAYCLRGQRSMAELHEALPDQIAFYFRPYWNVLESTEAAAANRSKPAREQIEQTKLLARAIAAAERQGKLWEFHDALLAADRAQYTKDGLASIAGSVDGLDGDLWNQQLDDAETQAAVDAHHEACAALGVDKGVPVYFINGRMMTGAAPTQMIRRVIEVEANGGFEKLPKP
jgi:protein-disulfide isomerase